jgi:protein tyrosine/serine phosphatase
MKRLATLASVLLLSIAAFYAVDFALNEMRRARLPKNFSVVKPGALYRGGQMSQEHFERVIAEHGIRTVICMNPGEAAFDESAVAASLGARYEPLPMPGSGQGAPEQFHRALELLADPSHRPALVHCNAGAYRTGAMVALYRLLFDGWSMDDVVAEMKYSGFAGQQDLIEHVRRVYASIPPTLKEQVAYGRADRAYVR